MIKPRALKKSFYLPANAKLLFSPKDHTPALNLTWSVLIIGRVQQIAVLFGLLTLSWIVIDAAFLPRMIWEKLALCRVIASSAFVLLAVSCSQHSRSQLVYCRLFLLFAIPIQFLLVANLILDFRYTDVNASIMSTIYAYSLFIVATGISFFPLTITESVLLLGLPMILSMSFLLWALPNMLITTSGFSMIWVLLLILCTSVLAAASQLGFVLKLFDDTAYDSITGLFRRNVGATILDQQFQAGVRQNAAFAILFIDLDHFKKINDQFGHDVGDKVLKNVADHLKKTMRRQDIAIRWGGEEFLIALPNTDATQAKGFLQRLANEGFGLCPDGRRVMASIGVAECRHDTTNELDTLINLADKRVYMAKQAGRNCYVIQDEAIRMLE